MAEGISTFQGPHVARRRVLFVAEAVTLAHVGRAHALAKALDPARYEVHFACDPRYGALFSREGMTWHRCNSISSEHFLRCVRNGKPFLDVATLTDYVGDDLFLIDTIRPDVVVGDFRLSLSVSARVAGVPYVSIFNAYWSPYAQQRFIVPDIPVVETFGPKLGQLLFAAVRRPVFAWYCHAFNRVRRNFGMAPIGSDLLRVYTDGDITLYADLPDLVPTFDRPSNHRFIGPVLWSPEIPRPSWWNELDSARPLVYVSLGSSGPPNLLEEVLEALADLPVQVIASSAGQELPQSVPRNARVAPYLPGDEAARRASLVIGNGGSLGVYQALAEGTPVLGLPSILDQYLNMAYVEQAGFGRLMRAGNATRSALRQATEQMMLDVSHRVRARHACQSLKEWRGEVRFAEFFEQTFEASALARAA